MAAEFAEQQSEPHIWAFRPATAEDVARARHSLAASPLFTEVKEPMILAVSELAGNFFQHHNVIPGKITAIRYDEYARLEVIIPNLSTIEREFQKMFWHADFARARFLMGRKRSGQVLFANEYTPKLSEGGRGSLMVHLDADRRGFEPYVDEYGNPGANPYTNPASKVWLEYDFIKPTDSLPAV